MNPTLKRRFSFANMLEARYAYARQEYDTATYLAQDTLAIAASLGSGALLMRLDSFVQLLNATSYKGASPLKKLNKDLGHSISQPGTTLPKTIKQNNIKDA